MTSRASSIMRATPSYSDVTAEAIQNYQESLRRIHKEFVVEESVRTPRVLGFNVSNIIKALHSTAR